jgi:plastocyanin
MQRQRAFQATAAIAGLLTASLAAAPAVGESTVSKTGVSRVRVMDNFFEPRSTVIRQNDRVVWLWRGENSHNVTFTKVPKGVSKKGADTRREGRWTRKFRKRGYYKYVCTIHAGQRGSIEVTARPQAARPSTPAPAAGVQE